MKTFEFRQLISQAPAGDQQALRDCARLIDMTGLPPLAFAGLRRGDLVAAIRRYADACIHEAEIPAGFQTPEKYAKPILFAMGRFFKDVDGAPAVDVPILKRVTPEPTDTRPPTLAIQVAKWTPKIIGSKVAGTTPAISEKRKEGIETAYWKYVALCRRAGLPLDDLVSLTGITTPDAQDCVVEEIKAAYSLSTIPSFMCSVGRLVEDTLGSTHENVNRWKANEEALRVGQSLAGERIEELRDLSAISEKPTVWEIPGRIAQRARRVKRNMDQDALLASAIAVAIALDVLAASPATLAKLNLREDLLGHGADRAIRVQTERGKQVFSLGAEATGLLDEQAELRSSVGRPSVWLFQNFKTGGFKTVSGTLNYVATAIQAARGSRYTTVDLQDAISVNQIDHGCNLSALSDARGVKNIHSTRARFKLAIDNPLHRK